jgi:hypothetical protein
MLSPLLVLYRINERIVLACFRAVNHLIVAESVVRHRMQILTYLLPAMTEWLDLYWYVRRRQCACCACCASVQRIASVCMCVCVCVCVCVCMCVYVCIVNVCFLWRRVYKLIVEQQVRVRLAPFGFLCFSPVVSLSRTSDAMALKSSVAHLTDVREAVDKLWLSLCSCAVMCVTRSKNDPDPVSKLLMLMVPVLGAALRCTRKTIRNGCVTCVRECCACVVLTCFW